MLSKKIINDVFDINEDDADKELLSAHFNKKNFDKEVNDENNLSKLLAEDDSMTQSVNIGEMSRIR